MAMRKKAKSNHSKCSMPLSSGVLTERQVEVLRNQIRSNSLLIDHYIEVIDLLINKERCPKDANTLARLRNWLNIAISENDTFRRVLWRHMQWIQNQSPVDDGLDATSFLIGRIKSRERALIAQMAMK